MQDKIIHAFLNEIISKPWREISTTSIAAAHRLSEAEIEQFVSRPMAFFNFFTHRIETQVYERLSMDLLSACEEKDKIVEILMTKFEVMAPYKYFYRHMKDKLLHSADVTVTLMLEEYNALLRIMRHYAFTEENLLDQLKFKGLYGIYVLAIEAWLRDDTEDLSLTLETVDKMLRKGEKFLERYQ